MVPPRLLVVFGWLSLAGAGLAAALLIADAAGGHPWLSYSAIAVLVLAVPGMALVLVDTHGPDGDPEAGKQRWRELVAAVPPWAKVVGGAAWLAFGAIAAVTWRDGFELSTVTIAGGFGVAGGVLGLVAAARKRSPGPDRREATRRRARTGTRRPEPGSEWRR